MNYKKIASRKSIIFLLLIATFIISRQNLFAQNIYVPDTTLTHKERKEAKKEFLTKQLHASKSRLIIKGDAVFADLNTKVTFTGPNEILSASIGLEENLGLPSKRGFFSGSIIYRFTPSSGIYGQYYGINRETSGTTDQDYIFLGDTIQAGTQHTSYFNTQVLSLGYILSILQHHHAYLGVYFNVYMMDIKTGIRSEFTQQNSELSGLLPLPNFGLVGYLNIKKWFVVGGNLGYFGISTQGFGGHVTSFSLGVTFKPIHWLGIDLKYQTFDVNVDFPEDSYDINVEYKFHGPAVGLTLVF